MNNPKAGGDPEALRNAARSAKYALDDASAGLGGKKPPFIGHISDRFAETFQSEARSHVFAELRDKGAMVGGGAMAVDGVRRLIKKDENGKAHPVRGVVQTALGIGIFTAAVINRRNSQNGNDGHSL